MKVSEKPEQKNQNTCQCLDIMGAISRRLEDRKRRGDQAKEFREDVRDILVRITEQLKNDIQGQFLAKREPYEDRRNIGHDPATIKSSLLSDFDKLWAEFDLRMELVPGKAVLSLLNNYLQGEYSVSLTIQGIIASFEKHDIPQEMQELIESLDKFRAKKTSQ